MRRVLNWCQSAWMGIIRDNLFKFILAVLGIVFLCSIFVFWVESVSGNTLYGKLSDSFWWAIVTMATVGYGDKYPITAPGRILAVVVILSGISLTAVFTALVASYFVEKRIREDKGMEEIKFRRHIILCGWNKRAMRILKRILSEPRSPEVVLINELSEEHIANILRECKNGRVKYVRGDFVHEGVLLRANIKEADVVILLADAYDMGEAKKRADDKTILACFTIKSLNPDIRVCAEVEEEDSFQHLKRADVEYVVLIGGQNDFLLANAATSPGVSLATQEILSWGGRNILKQVKIPSSLVGQDFVQASHHFRKENHGILVGVVTEEEEGVDLSDILSRDMTAVDKFIMRKFEGLEETYFSKRKRLHIKINPPDDYRIRPQDQALIISKEETL